jgi:hypothetical protein
MGEIKFDFVYEFIKEDKSKFYIHRKYTLDEIMENMPQKISIIMTDYPECISCSLVAKRQYTGLKDKNSVETYKGDILKTRVHKTYSINLEVIWNEDRCCYEMNKKYQNQRYDFTCDTILDWDCEVVGNKYENKELLEEND